MTTLEKIASNKAKLETLRTKLAKMFEEERTLTQERNALVATLRIEQQESLDKLSDKDREAIKDRFKGHAKTVVAMGRQINTHERTITDEINAVAEEYGISRDQAWALR